jgi:hypothetical protein
METFFYLLFVGKFSVGICCKDLWRTVGLLMDVRKQFWKWEYVMEVRSKSSPKIVKKQSPQKIPQPNPIENESPKKFMSHKSKNPW